MFALLAASGCRVTDLALWGPANASSPFEVETIKAITYRSSPEAEVRRNQLDLFLPRGKKDCPVVVLVHGGAWIMGDNRCCGLYSSVGQFLASQGIVTVLPNYRLSPCVKHPEHIKDVARAVAWVHAHIGEYGGRPDQIFLLGHSAGGHLVSLLATDEQYLHEVGLAAKDLRGVMAVSGVYCIPPGSVSVKLGGQTPEAFGWDKMLPLRSSSPSSSFHLPGVPLNLDIFGPAFGPDAHDRAAASPINRVRPGLPPFLLFFAENDLPLLPGMAADFHQELVQHGCETQLLFVPERNHNSILFGAYTPSDPVAQAILEFITQHTAAESANRS
jgi:acetyl esterase/lipase